MHSKSRLPSLFARCSSIIHACILLQNDKRLLPIEEQLGDLALECMRINKNIFTRFKEERLESKVAQGELEENCDDDFIDIADELDDEEIEVAISSAEKRKREQLSLVIEAFTAVETASPSDFKPFFEFGRCLTEFPLEIRKRVSEACSDANVAWFSSRLLEYQKIVQANAPYLPNYKCGDTSRMNIDDARFHFLQHLDLLLPGFFSAEPILDLGHEGNLATRKPAEEIAGDSNTKKKAKFEPEDCPDEAKKIINCRLNPTECKLLSIFWSLEPDATLNAEQLACMLQQKTSGNSDGTLNIYGRKFISTTNRKLRNLLGSQSEPKGPQLIENKNASNKGRSKIGVYQLASDAKNRIRALTRSGSNTRFP